MSMTGVEKYAKYILTVQYFREISLVFFNLYSTNIKNSVVSGCNVTLLQIKPGKYFSTACWVQNFFNQIKYLLIQSWSHKGQLHTYNNYDQYSTFDKLLKNSKCQ